MEAGVVTASFTPALSVVVVVVALDMIAVEVEEEVLVLADAAVEARPKIESSGDSR